MALTKEFIQIKINQEQKLLDRWLWREHHATWNDDGHGNHIPADEMIKKYQARVDLLKELLKEIK